MNIIQYDSLSSLMIKYLPSILSSGIMPDMGHYPLPDNDEIGMRVRATRKALKLSQTDFGKAAGIAQNAISQFENGTQRLSLDATYALGQAHEIKIDYFFSGSLVGTPEELASRIRSASAK